MGSERSGETINSRGRKINRYFDHAVLKPGMTEQEVKDAIRLGIDYDVYSVCVRPCDIDLAISMCKGTNTLVSCVLDFPHGEAMLDAAKGRIKVKPSGGIRNFETAKKYVDMGAERMGVGFSSTPAICKGEEFAEVF